MKKQSLSFFLFLFTILATHFSLLAPSSLAAAVNYDTAWTYVYDGGVNSSGNPINDKFADVKVLSDGSYICVGQSAGYLFYAKLNSSGKVIWGKQFIVSHGGGGGGVVIAKNGDYLIGGYRWGSPLVMRIDTLGNIKWATWYYDSLANKSRFTQGAYLNSIQETTNGNIICAGGDEYPIINESTNYVALLKLDANGKVLNAVEWEDVPGYSINGNSIVETSVGTYMVGGKRAIYALDTVNLSRIWEKSYGFMLEGVGSVVHNVNRIKQTRNDRYWVLGQAYESNCWINYKTLYYDAWWTPISLNYGASTVRDTAGKDGSDDQIYDFAQLTNGNMAFVGTKATSGGGLTKFWTFVTDSTGRNVIFEKITGITGGLLSLGYSIVATSDTGFTIVGNIRKTGNTDDAIAMHFVPKAPVNSANELRAASKTAGLQARVVGNRLVVVYPLVTPLLTKERGSRAMALSYCECGEVCLFSISGKRVSIPLSDRRGVAESRGEVGVRSLSYDISHLSKGMYFVNVETTTGKMTTKVMVK